jgi:hypothetical protein
MELYCAFSIGKFVPMYPEIVSEKQRRRRLFIVGHAEEEDWALHEEDQLPARA